MTDIEKLKDKFGKMLVESCRRAAVVNYFSMLNHEQKFERISGITYGGLDDKSVEGIKKIIVNCVDSAMNSFLFALDNPEEYADSISILVNNKEILDGDMQGSLNLGDSWIERFGDIDDLNRDSYLD